MSGNEKIEREFESFLKDEDSRVAALYRKLPRPEPDAKLDAAVLALARRTHPGATPARPRASRWLPALSAAAIVALAAGIAFRIGPTVWQQRRSAPLPPAENAVSAPAAAAPAAADTGTFKDKTAPKPVAAPQSTPQAVPSPAAPPPPVMQAKPETPAPLRKMEAAKRADAPAPQAFPMQSAPEQKAAQAGAVAGTRDAVGAQAGHEMREKDFDRPSDERQTAPAAPAAAAPPPAREEPPPPPAETPAAQAAGSVAAESRLAAPTPAKAAPVRSKDPNARLYPEHWLENIRKMLREDKREEALRSLAEFRRMYPDYHLPDDLRDLK